MKNLFLVLFCFCAINFSGFSNEEKSDVNANVYEVFISKDSPQLFNLYAFTPCSTWQNVYLDGVWQGWQVTYNLSLGCSGSAQGPDINNYTCYMCHQQ